MSPIPAPSIGSMRAGGVGIDEIVVPSARASKFGTGGSARIPGILGGGGGALTALPGGGGIWLCSAGRGMMGGGAGVLALKKIGGSMAAPAPGLLANAGGGGYLGGGG